MITLTSTEDINKTIAKITNLLNSGGQDDLSHLTRCLAMHGGEIKINPSELLKILVYTRADRAAAFELIELEEFEWIQNNFLPRLETITEKHKSIAQISSVKERKGKLGTYIKQNTSFVDYFKRTEE